ncbi:MAG: hypothetical protein AMXMBFR46_12950 [Acidimicrobiia bacterium]
MARIDNPDLYNPYGWRLADLADPETSPERRRQLYDDLLIWEAQEVAYGYRHLTVVHGDPDDLDTSRRLTDFYETLRRLAAALPSLRVRGTTEFVTITVHGSDADAQVAVFADAARAANPGTWQIVFAAYPPGVAV